MVASGLEVDERAEHATWQATADKRSGKGLHDTGTGAGSGREMKRPTRVPVEQGACLGVLVSGIIASDR
jgi:hypothetical protein